LCMSTLTNIQSIIMRYLSRERSGWRNLLLKAVVDEKRKEEKVRRVSGYSGVHWRATDARSQATRPRQQQRTEDNSNTTCEIFSFIDTVN
jgi:hypothetical protein